MVLPTRTIYTVSPIAVGVISHTLSKNKTIEPESFPEMKRKHILPNLHFWVLYYFSGVSRDCSSPKFTTRRTRKTLLRIWSTSCLGIQVIQETNSATLEGPEGIEGTETTLQKTNRSNLCKSKTLGSKPFWEGILSVPRGVIHLRHFRQIAVLKDFAPILSVDPTHRKNEIFVPK